MLKIFLTNLHHFYHTSTKQFVLHSKFITNLSNNYPLLSFKQNVTGHALHSRKSQAISEGAHPSINKKIFKMYTTSKQQQQSQNPALSTGQKNDNQQKSPTQHQQKRTNNRRNKSTYVSPVDISHKGNYFKNVVSYGFYDWDKEQTYEKAVLDGYLLNDLIYGFRRLKQKNLQYNQYHINFMAYVAVLYPEIQQEIIQVFKGALEKVQNSGKNQYFLKTIKALCFGPTKMTQNGQEFKIRKNNWNVLLKPYFLRRINNPENLKSVELIHKNILNNCFENMGSLGQIFETFKKLLHKDLSEKRYNLTSHQKKIIIETYESFILFDDELRKQPFFQAFPQIFLEDEQCLNKLIELLIEAISFNSVYFTNDNDVLAINEKIGKCKNFKSKDTKRMLRKYSQHLVIVNKIQLINFTNILDPV